MLDLNFKFGTFNSLTDESTALKTLQSLSNGDICFATYGSSSTDGVASISEEGNTATDNLIPVAGALFIKMNDNLLPVSLPPGEQGIPLVGQGDSATPVYSSTLSYIGVGGNPIINPSTITAENVKGNPYSLTVYGESLFKEDIVFEQVIKSNNGYLVIDTISEGQATMFTPKGLRIELKNTDEEWCDVTIGTNDISAYFSKWTDISAGDMYLLSDLNYFINGQACNYDTSAYSYFQASVAELYYETTRYDSNYNYLYNCQLRISSDIMLYTDTGYAQIVSDSARIELNNTSYHSASLSNNSILLKSGTNEGAKIKLESLTTELTSEKINLTNSNSQIIRGGASCQWWNGRDSAILRLDQTVNTGYYPIISTKANSYSWEIGTYPGSIYQQDKLIITGIPDTVYASGANSTSETIHFKFGENGVLETKGIAVVNYGTNAPETGNKIIAGSQGSLLPGTIYFKIIE